MDSLVASYASSDEEEDAPRINSKPSSTHNAGISSSLPPPKPSLFNSLPPPKSSANPTSHPKFGENSKPKSTSLFSSMPQPKSSSSSSSSNPKRVVQFRPPPIVEASAVSFNDEDVVVDEGEKDRQTKKSNPGATAFSLPAPRFSNSLGTLGGGRKSMFETVVSEGKGVEQSNAGENVADHSNFDGGYGYSAHDVGSVDENNAYYGAAEIPSYDYSSVNYTNPGECGAVDGSETVDYSYGNDQHVDYTSASNSYVDYANDQQYPTAMPEVSNVISDFRLPMKRGRKEAMPQIIEVKQDELVKNRPREDKSKTTFGPAYQPASSKGKPTKLHKRKHQISALYFDMRQKETELAERRSRGFQTKAQTQGKYGW